MLIDRIVFGVGGSVSAECLVGAGIVQHVFLRLLLGLVQVCTHVLMRWPFQFLKNLLEALADGLYSLNFCPLTW